MTFPLPMFKSFSEFLCEEKNTHMTHIEDKLLYGGVDGTRQAINALRDLRNMLGAKKTAKISVKWDGAPAIFAGIDPRDGKFFVAKKGIFNKTPKVYKTAKEIEADTSGDLADKLKLALKYLPALGIKNVIQGDFLFGPSDKKTQQIGDVTYVTFHPNTLVYAIPVDQAQDVMRAKIGIVWHTTYQGTSFESMNATYGVNIASLNKSSNVWSQDAMLRDVQSATLSENETEEINEYLTQIGKLFNEISGSTLRTLESDGELARLIEQFNNLFVRKGAPIGESGAHVEKLIRWISKKYQKEISSRKSEKGRTVQVQERDKILSFFSLQNKQSLKKLFDLQKLIVIVKIKLIVKLNSLSNYDTFVQTKNGFRTTGDEGYVVIDTLGKNAVKLVNRMEFSYNNFSPDIVKGWHK
jgi:hypothetical protein